MSKNDLASDRTSDHGFLANQMRLFFCCAAYVLHQTLRSEILADTELANAQPSTVIIKLFKIAVRVVQYKDRVRLHLPSSCPLKALLKHVTEQFLLPRQSPSPADSAPRWPRASASPPRLQPISMLYKAGRERCARRAKNRLMPHCSAPPASPDWGCCLLRSPPIVPADHETRPSVTGACPGKQVHETFGLEHPVNHAFFVRHFVEFSKRHTHLRDDVTHGKFLIS